jgi:hypothetical protein
LFFKKNAHFRLKVGENWDHNVDPRYEVKISFFLAASHSGFANVKIVIIGESNLIKLTLDNPTIQVDRENVSSGRRRCSKLECFKS